MLPPISPAVFEQNPKFKVLFNDLNASRLTPDGSTKLLKKQRDQDELKKKLQTARIDLAKSQLIRNSLESLGSRSLELPPELRQVVQIICAQLDGSLTADDRDVLVEDYEYFVEHIEDVAKALSGHLTESAQHVALVVGAIDDPSARSAAPLTSTIPSKASALRSTLQTQSATLAAKTVQLADIATALSLHNRELLQSATRILEQSMHGTVSRATRVKAEHLATVARGMELKLSIITHAANPANPESAAGDDELRRSLDAYAVHLRRAKVDLENKAVNIKERLKGYDSAGSGMREIAKRYAELTVERELVRQEIVRLQEAD